jgi:hypothetical protein
MVKYFVYFHLPHNLEITKFCRYLSVKQTINHRQVIIN